MDFQKEVPGPVAWGMRLVLWPIALIAIFAMLVFTSSLRLGHHLEGCVAAPTDVKAGEPGSALAFAQHIAECLDEKSGWLEKIALRFQKGSVQHPEPVPCFYVGRWAATRPDSLFEVTLTPDHLFVAKAVKTDDRYNGSAEITGAWFVEGKRIAWLYDNEGRVWPPERNPVVDRAEDTFTLVELNGVRTRYVRLEPVESQGCAEKG